MHHEQDFVRAFIVADKQDRYWQKLTSRGRRRFLARLDHGLDYDPRFATRIPASEQTAVSIETLLRQSGAPAICHVISSREALDGRDIPLRDALEQVVGFDFGTVLSCVPGHLAYYEAEEIGERYLLVR